MKQIILIPLFLVSGCSTHEEVNSKEWACTKVGSFVSKDGLIAGSAYMEIPTKKVGCVQWSRMEVLP